MKDLYSFSQNQEEHAAFYEESKKAYMNVFARLGLKDKTYLTFASGGSFSTYSHEFQTVSDAGEDIIYVSKEKNIAINKEVYNDEVLTDLGLTKDDLTEEKAIEVGNIFTLGTKFSEALGLEYVNAEGKKEPVFMGSYGIGPSRLMGVIAELYSDEHGLMWPASVAPYDVHLVSLCKDDDDTKKANALYKQLQEAGFEVLYDDRAGVRPGQKFADSDLIGIPLRIVISNKTIEKEEVEYTIRKTGETAFCKMDELDQIFR